MASDFEAFEAQLREKNDRINAQLRETNDKINARTGRPLITAILVGLVLGVSLLLSLLVWKPLFMVFAGVLIGFTTYELASALRSAGRHIPRVPIIIVSLAIVPAAFFWGGIGQWLATLAALVIVAVWRLVQVAAPTRRVTSAELGKDLGGSAFVIAYVGFLASFSVLLTAQDGGQWHKHLGPARRRCGGGGNRLQVGAVVGQVAQALAGAGVALVGKVVGGAGKGVDGGNRCAQLGRAQQRGDGEVFVVRHRQRCAGGIWGWGGMVHGADCRSSGLARFLDSVSAIL